MVAERPRHGYQIEQVIEARGGLHITPAGEDALRAGVFDAPSATQPCYSPLKLALANLPVVSRAEALPALGQYRDALSDRLKHVEACCESQQPLPYFLDAMFGHSISMNRAELRWITEFTSQLTDQADR